MCKRYWTVVAIVVGLLAPGCSKPSSDTNSAQKNNDSMATAIAADPTGPAASVGKFLEALRTGDDQTATEMLSSAAREKTASLQRSITPPASDTASFTIGQVEYISEDGARVSCTWTDVDEDGQQKTDEAIWVVRHEPEGWRVAGVAATIFPGEPPLLLNFEDPEDMFRKQQWVREEIRRRLEAEELQAQGSENPEKPLRR